MALNGSSSFSMAGLSSLGPLRLFINDIILSLRDYFVSRLLTAEQQHQTQTLTGRICRGLFSAIFFLQTILIFAFAIFLTLQGLFSAESQYFHPKKWYPPILTSTVVSGVISLIWQASLLWNIKATVRITFWFTPVLTIIVGVSLVLEGSAPAIGVLVVIFSFLQAAYGWNYIIPKKRDYTYKILSICTLHRPARTCATVFVSVTCCIFYSSVLAGGIGGGTVRRTGMNMLYKSLIVVSMAWSMAVCKNVIVVATSKATYKFYEVATSTSF